ncbi:hypothetical protein GUJ93_ZPchr0014g46706 [Zizania palustris]|uniref:Uncharacterized protein n=1 Tax=Zizania palustris TaxID=103762 RepID=A0A8J5VUM5_ZIZPA|nr:hypothetical protein GUJ93_ZPchr0014g46706 [Zizania palustris]
MHPRRERTSGTLTFGDPFALVVAPPTPPTYSAPRRAFSRHSDIASQRGAPPMSGACYSGDAPFGRARRTTAPPPTRPVPRPRLRTAFGLSTSDAPALTTPAASTRHSRSCSVPCPLCTVPGLPLLLAVAQQLPCGGARLEEMMGNG